MFGVESIPCTNSFWERAWEILNIGEYITLLMMFHCHIKILMYL